MAPRASAVTLLLLAAAVLLSGRPAIATNVDNTGSRPSGSKFPYPIGSASQAGVDEPVLPLLSFGMEEDGYFHVRVEGSLQTITPEDVAGRSMLQLLLCTEEEYDSVIARDELSRQTYCESGLFRDQSLCQSWNMTLRDEDWEDTYRAWAEVRGYVRSRGLYFFVMANCEVFGSIDASLRSESDDCAAVTSEAEAMDASCAVYPSLKNVDVAAQSFYTIYNPGIGFISYTLQPIKQIYLVAIIFWLALTLIWLAVVFFAKTKGLPVTLQFTLAGPALLKMVVLLLETLLWSQRESGVKQSSTESLLEPLLTAANLAFVSAFAFLLLLLSSGWAVTRPELASWERRSLYLTVGAYGLGSLAYSQWGTDEGGSTAFLSLLLLTITFVTVLYNIWYSILTNINALQYQADVVVRHGMQLDETPLALKLKMFTSYRRLFTFYVLTSIITEVIGLFTSRHAPWLPRMMTETLQLLTTILLAAIFRPRPSPIFFAVRSPARVDPGTAAASMAGIPAGMRWAPGEIVPMPDLPPPPVPRRFVMVLNPDGRSCLGGSLSKKDDEARKEEKPCDAWKQPFAAAEAAAAARARAAASAEAAAPARPRG
eukprot:PLAT5160.1.p1 GENE.PLAT5160.1~~PLAT5160.1.p1  ORF type:complete len:598 (+),score=180.25 PLAT5160.1:38-1831(+)